MRAADDFRVIRMRLEELRREREQAMHREPEDRLRIEVQRVPIEEIAKAAQGRLKGLFGSRRQ